MERKYVRERIPLAIQNLPSSRLGVTRLRKMERRGKGVKRKWFVCKEGEGGKRQGVIKRKDDSDSNGVERIRVALYSGIYFGIGGVGKDEGVII